MAGLERRNNGHAKAGTQRFGFSGSGHLKPQEVFEKRELDLSTGPEKYLPMLPDEFRKVSLKLLNVIVQSRDDYGDIGSLANGIKKERILIHHPLVAQFNEQGARMYLNFVYGLYGDKIKAEERKTISDLTPKIKDGEKIYYIVISGHRRLRALEINGVDRIMVKVVKDIDPLHSLYLQAQENTAKPLRDEERAEQHGKLWRVSRALNPKLTLQEFAKSVGTTADAIRRDLRYFILPDEVKEYVVPARQDLKNMNFRQYCMPFNVACQIGRLVDAKADLPDILFLSRRFFEEGVSSETTASERVSRYIKNNVRTKANDMTDIFGVNMERIAKIRKRSQVEKRFAGPLDNALAFFERVAQAQERDKTGSTEDLLSLAAAAPRLETLAKVMDRILPYLKDQIRNPEVISQVIAEMKEVMDDIGRNLDAPVSLPQEHILTEGVPSSVLTKK